nr:exosortase family protein XrtF [uncultured Flavobacterium sp.]
MKKLFLQYKPFFLFLVKFIALYVVLTVAYKFYLNQFDESRNEVDGFTQIVAEQSKELLFFFGKDTRTVANASEPSVYLLYKNKYVARIVEGCNALSVMILFAAFVFAFSSKWLKTGLYILIGCLIIHVFNVVRIALLAMALYDYPQYEHFLHGVVFPLVIYGLVFILWVLWIQKFSGYAKKNLEK